MKSPRHRWNCIAQPMRHPLYQPDGLVFTSTPDKICQELKKVVTGKSRTKAYLRAWDLFQNDSTRLLYESVLFATRDVNATARIFKERPDYLQVYADCFFDITVFESEGDRVLWLDRFSKIDPRAAVMMRNAMAMSAEELLFLSDKANGKKVDAKTAIEGCLTFYFNAFKVFTQLKIETIIDEEATEQQKQHTAMLLAQANNAARNVKDFAELLLRYELDKTADNFLEEFQLALTPQPPAALIKDKPTKDDEIY